MGRREELARLLFLVFGAVSMALCVELAARLFLHSVGGIAPVATEVALRLD